MGFSNVVGTTKSNIKRNKWMAFSTIVVIAIVFCISTFFIGTALISNKAVQYFETKAQVIVYFKTGTPEPEIFNVRDLVRSTDLIEDVIYISESQAVELYMEDYKDDPQLLETITVGTLPASLEVRAKSIDDLLDVMNMLSDEKLTNPYIDDIWYFKDVVDRMSTISDVINAGTIIISIILIGITFALIMITIGFNILSHKDEIEIMHLVGSTDSFIKYPYILEGSYYGLIGTLISSLLFLVPWATMIIVGQGTDMFFTISQQLNGMSLGFLAELNPIFIVCFISVQIVIGTLLGALGSYTAVVKYLKLEEK